MGDESDAMDRISELPPFIIHHIMSYLSPKEVAQTSILSRRWNLLRTSFPIFNLDQTYFVGDVDSIWKGKSFRDQLNKFFKFVDSSLLRFCQLKFCMQKFRLYVSLIDVRASSYVVDNWIRMAVENQVKDLDLDFITGKNLKYTLPRIIFSAQFVINLKVARCMLEQYSGIIRLNSLKKLTLKLVFMDEEMAQKLINECPLLEDLDFDHCWGFKHFCVPRAPKLKTMKVVIDDKLGSVEISVPCIQQLELDISGERLRVFDIARCSHLKKLDLAGVKFTNQEFHHLLSKLCLLEDFSLSDCDSLEKIAISSDRLKKLLVGYCANLKTFEVDTPNLLSFTYEYNSVPTAFIYAPCPWKVRFCFEGDFDASFFIKLKEFLRESNKIEELSISMTSNENLLNMNELKESPHSLRCQVGELKLSVYVPSTDYPALLDGLLWICYPRTLSLISWLKNQRKFIEWLYEKLRNRDGSCCNSHQNPIKCWEHNLKDINIGSTVSEGQKLMNIDMEDFLPIFPDGLLEFHLSWCSF